MEHESTCEFCQTWQIVDLTLNMEKNKPQKAIKLKNEQNARKEQLNSIMALPLREAAAQYALGSIFFEVNLPDFNSAATLVSYIAEEHTIPSEGLTLYSPLEQLMEEDIVELLKQIFEKKIIDLTEFEQGYQGVVKEKL